MELDTDLANVVKVNVWHESEHSFIQSSSDIKVDVGSDNDVEVIIDNTKVSDVMLVCSMLLL